MSSDSTSSRGRVNSCCGGSRARDESNRRGETYQSTLEFYRTTRAQTLAMIQGISQAQMDYAPASGKWSVGEVLDHLLLGEKLNRGYIAQLIEMKEAGRQPVLRLSFADVNVSVGYIPKSLLPFVEVPFTLLNIFLPGSVRDFMTLNRLVPAQNADHTTPRRGRPADELRRELTDSLKETEALLQDNSHLNYHEMLIQHPLMGNNDIPGLLRFLALHEQRHQSQLSDIMSSPRFPAAIPGQQPTTQAGGER